MTHEQMLARNNGQPAARCRPADVCRPRPCPRRGHHRSGVCVMFENSRSGCKHQLPALQMPQRAPFSVEPHSPSVSSLRPEKVSSTMNTDDGDDGNDDQNLTRLTSYLRKSRIAVVNNYSLAVDRSSTDVDPCFSRDLANVNKDLESRRQTHAKPTTSKGAEDYERLRCPSRSTEDVARHERRRHHRLDFPGVCFSASLFQSSAMMKYCIIGNELHNIANVHMKRVRFHGHRRLSCYSL
ncbi:unnamed protein product [Soboliphyme baturini]|uniref:Uncharacterized protein n=1 Tax=Soboliphyme baturini TaxID=241478 RepID=A0A183IMD2_9BILA|nr:unnamed protein product [Soboliphyme baturini]